MGDFSSETIIRDTRIFAKDDKPVQHNRELKLCGSCGSSNTICIHEEAEGCIIGWSIEEEYLCKDCGMYTAYVNDYES